MNAQDQHALGPKAAVVAMGLILACALSPSVRAQSLPTSSDAEAQLERIRQAIVSAANERPTQVLSTAWIDQNGKLHESAHFQTDGEVRGVRVLSYLNAKELAKSQPMNIQVELLPSAWRQKAKAAQQCEPPTRRLRQPLKIFSESPTGLAGDRSYYSQTLLSQAQSMWEEKVNTSSRWWPQGADLAISNSYLNALTSDTSSEIAWGVRLSLSVVQAAKPPATRWYERLQKKMEKLDADYEEGGPPWLWELSMAMGTLTFNGSFEPHWHHNQTLSVDSAEQVLTPQRWLSMLSDKLRPVIEQWAQALEKAWACEPVQFQVSKPIGDGLLINAGRRSGLAQGDRLLLVAPEHIPAKIFEQGSMSHLRLAEVVQVGQNQTMIRQLAGPPTSSQGRWLAMPL